MYSAEPWRKYYVVCCEAIVDFWWSRFLRPGYRHCYVLIWDGALWQHIDPVMERVHVAILDHYEPTHPAAWIEDPTARVFEAIPESVSGTPWMAGPITCVEVVKRVMGIRKWWIWTPWQLAQYLRAKRRGTESQEAEADRRRSLLARRANAGDRPAGPGDQREEAHVDPLAAIVPGQSLVG